MNSSESCMVKINQGYLLPVFIRVAAMAVCVGVLVTVLITPFQLKPFIFYSIIAYFCFMIFTARHYLEFNTDQRVCFKYVWVLGLKLGNKRSYQFIEKLYVNKIQLVSTNKYNTNSLLIEMKHVVYRCYLKFDDGEKIFLDEDGNKERLFERLVVYRDRFKTSLYDTTTHEPLLVD